MTKGPQAFRTISEAADEIGVPQHVLRFWETKFRFIDPLKRAGGRRFYRPQDIAALKGVQRLLHEDGLTIKGVQKLHKDQGVHRIIELGQSDAVVFDVDATAVPSSTPVSVGKPAVRLQQALAELEGARARLEAVLARPT